MMLQIRDLDDDTWQALRRQADANRRSLSAEAAVALRNVLLGSAQETTTRRTALLAQIAQGAKRWPADLPEVESLLADDRQR
jgi:plasmid stability protein